MSQEAAGQAMPRLPLGLVGMIGLVALAELFFARHAGLEFSSIWASDRVITGRACRRVARDCKVLCLGDSMAKLGLAPAVIERVSGLRTYNLALHGGPAPASYYLLRRALESGARPAAVLVDFKPRFLRWDPLEFVRPWTESLGLREGHELARTAGDASFFGSFVVGRLLPSARARHEIRSSLMEALRGQASFARGYLPGLWRNWRVNRGAQMMSESFQMVPENPLWCVSGAWNCHPVNAAYLRRFLRLAAEHDITVFWVLMPILPESQAGSEQNGFDASYAGYVRGIQAQFSNLVVLDGRHSGYDRTALSDPMHLNRRGAGVLSADVAACVAQRRDRGGPPRWVELPPYAARRIELPLEDVNQSKMALDTAGRVRR